MIKTIQRLLALTLLTSTSLASAQEVIHPVLSDKFTFKLGALDNRADGELRVTRPPLPEIPIKLSDLNIEDSDVAPWAAFRWRFKDRWSLNFMFNRYESDGTVVVEDEFNFDGEVYPVGLGVNSGLRADAYIMDVSYAFMKKKNQEFGVGIGLHAFDLQAKLQAGAYVGDIEGVTPPAQSEDLIAPVPNLRAYYLYAFNSRVHVKMDVGWLSANYEDYEGRFYYASIAGEYRFTERFGAGLGYEFTDVDFNYDKGNGDETEFDMLFDSLQVYLTYSF